MASEADSFSDDLTGFVLAGGASRRMGRDKARIPWEDGTLLTHAIEQMKCAASKVFVIGQLDRRFSNKSDPGSDRSSREFATATAMCRLSSRSLAGN